MTASTTRSPPADGGYPQDHQLHQMSDDGGPVGPDPARWDDPVWRDSAAETPPARASTRRRSGRPSEPGLFGAFAGVTVGLVVGAGELGGLIPSLAPAPGVGSFLTLLGYAAIGSVVGAAVGGLVGAAGLAGGRR